MEWNLKSEDLLMFYTVVWTAGPTEGPLGDEEKGPRQRRCKTREEAMSWARVMKRGHRYPKHAKSPEEPPIEPTHLPDNETVRTSAKVYLHVRTRLDVE